ncbi:MAG: prepilin-type N-terminal cleavage/methylation domain-containing protein [Candidatus Gracilibacteria bacterium]|nr:prepilin-type N-terminal cleavage/methylation domain-containing protein [Candidatus Gracilibacteria bacterium]
MLNKIKLKKIFKGANIFKSINFINNKAFTLPEVVIATFISGIILSFIFIFLSDISSGISDSKKETVLMYDFYDFTYKLNNYRNVYITGGIIVDNTSTGSDVFLMRDVTGENGILIGAVNLADNKLDTDNTIYENRGIGFRKISNEELLDIDMDVSNIYELIFQDDNIFSDLKLQDLSFESYNSGEIFEINVLINKDFQNNLVGQYWNDLPRDNLKKFNIDF